MPTQDDPMIIEAFTYGLLEGELLRNPKSYLATTGEGHTKARGEIKMAVNIHIDRKLMKLTLHEARTGEEDLGDKLTWKRKVTSIKFGLHDPIPFDYKGTEPLIIKTTIGRTIIRRVYVDNGSVVSVVYEHCLKRTTSGYPKIHQAYHSRCNIPNFESKISILI
uniref:Uncharacterized protein n=1 Tax=Lactuca sativa TaxID=4236 RepID=A0A9R1XTX8_LACSA|nr:hypothetical protein LSAT_V11C200077210 [Lactuca sativa]